jgi:hypothetical protein
MNIIFLPLPFDAQPNPLEVGRECGYHESHHAHARTSQKLFAQVAAQLINPGIATFGQRAIITLILNDYVACDHTST